MTYVALVESSDLRFHLIAMLIAFSLTFMIFFGFFVAFYILDRYVILD
jgi:hypothetical protein